MLDCEFSEWKFARRRRISRSHCSGSWKSKQPNRWLTWLTRTIQNQLRENFPDCEELDMMMAAALKRCYDKQTHFRKNISKGQLISQRETNCLLDLRIFSTYWVPRSGLFSIKLENDDIQDFHLRWEQALLLISSSDNYGTIQPRNSARKRKTRLSQTENVCEIAY